MKTLIIFLMLLTCINSAGQTVINRSGTINGEQYVTPYDSLSNFRKFRHNDEKDYYHLIGQDAIYIGNPYTDKPNTRLSVGSVYIIIDVLPDEGWNGALCYLKVKDKKTGEIIRVEPGVVDRLNISWIINGYVEKLHASFAGARYAYCGSSNYSHSNADYLINCKTNTISKNVPDGTIWEFVEIQILPRLKNDNMELDVRGPVVFVMDNPEYGRHYVYYEDSNGYGETGPFCSMFKRIQSSVDISSLDHIIGMTEEKCIEQLGEPIGTGKSVSIINGKREIKNILTFPGNVHIIVENGIVTDIEIK